MDPPTDLPELLEDYTANIDDLTSALTPLLKAPLRTTTSTLPLLDKAKLNILTAYAIESLLFNTLQASGADAKSHAVFPELARLKTYFAKVNQAEGAAEQPKAKLDKDAAARFIKHGLAGNDKYDRERAEQIAKERARASAKAAMLNKKFNQEDEERRQAELAAQARMRKQAAGVGDVEMRDQASSEDEDEKKDQEEEEEDHVDSENEAFYGTTAPAPAPSTTSTRKSHTTDTSKKRKSRTAEDKAAAKAERKAERRARKVAQRLERAKGGRGRGRRADDPPGEGGPCAGSEQRRDAAARAQVAQSDVQRIAGWHVCRGPEEEGEGSVGGKEAERWEEVRWSGGKE